MENSFKEYLESLGTDFIESMENDKYDSFQKAFEFLTNAFNMTDDLNNKDIGEYLEMLVSKFFEYGYYSGVNYAIDPENKNRKVMLKLYKDKLNGNSSN